MNKTLVFGKGYNDADYKVSKYDWVNGHNKVIWRCQFYARWCDMLRRAYSKSYHKTYPTYEGCEVCEEWLTFSNFKSWMEQQDWEGKHLDKDILSGGIGKLYSPEVCVFIAPKINTFLVDCKGSRGAYKVGVTYRKSSGRFLANCQDPFKRVYEYLGSFATEEEAHEAWRKRKYEHALHYAELQRDVRIKEMLESRFSEEVWYELHSHN